MEISYLELWLIIVFMASMFLAGLCWCFCCGTCVGQNLLRHAGFSRYLPRDRRNDDQRHWKYHVPPEEHLSMDRQGPLSP
ncbi:hypothetical protein BX666DRAFT_1887804 [Dichotomocladium elegans]|nr:hypothetical protein BX666DRAFT_1887804 [Dichotomocladium elegans]